MRKVTMLNTWGLNDDDGNDGGARENSNMVSSIIFPSDMEGCHLVRFP
jgi:hypothetical protein